MIVRDGHRSRGHGTSGFGREEGLDAIENYTQVKNVCANIERRRR